jgi:hypothetical protein
MPQIPTVTNGLTVRAGTEIGGDLTYESGTEALIPPGAVAGEVNRQVPEVTTEEEQERDQRAEAAAATNRWWRNNLGNLLALLVVGLLLVWFAPRFVQNGAAALQAKPLPAQADRLRHRFFRHCRRTATRCPDRNARAGHAWRADGLTIGWTVAAVGWSTPSAAVAYTQDPVSHLAGR